MYILREEMDSTGQGSHVQLLTHMMNQVCQCGVCQWAEGFMRCPASSKQQALVKQLINMRDKS